MSIIEIRLMVLYHISFELYHIICSTFKASLPGVSLSPAWLSSIALKRVFVSSKKTCLYLRASQPSLLYDVSKSSYTTMP